MKPTGQMHSLDSRTYGLDVLQEIVETPRPLQLHASVRQRVETGARFVDACVEKGNQIYGVNTGYGSLCEVPIERSDMASLQFNHVVSHACGMGELADLETVRWTMLIKLLTFRSGNTGITTRPLDALIALWNGGAVPAVPSKGTVGASGDLAPLAHLALPLLGLGQVHLDGALVDGAEALEKLGLRPLVLGPKEGLALTNGVQYINAMACRCIARLEGLVRAADAVSSLSAQAFSAARSFYQAAYHETSLHPERHQVAENLRNLLDGSNHWKLSSCTPSQQDPYSFRCIPQVHGAVRQTLGFARVTLEREVNGVSDNPLFFPDREEVHYGGNLHGQSTAFALDFLAIASCELASISERRSWQLLSGKRQLPDFLSHDPGLHSGFMVAQYTAAAFVNECKVLATPASMDTIPTCQNQEDSVSMGGTSGYKLAQSLDNLERVLGIELLLAAQAVEMNEGLELSPAGSETLSGLREHVPHLREDRPLSDDMERARACFVERASKWRRTLL